MKTKIWLLHIENRHGPTIDVYGVAGAAEASQIDYVRKQWDARNPIYLIDYDRSKMTDAEIVDAFFGHPASDEDASDIDEREVDIHLTVPKDPVQAARAALEALAFARDCLKAAGAVRAADKARLALSSAKGAARHVENKAARPQVEVFEDALARADATRIEIERQRHADAKAARATEDQAAFIKNLHAAECAGARMGIVIDGCNLWVSTVNFGDKTFTRVEDAGGEGKTLHYAGDLSNYNAGRAYIDGAQAVEG